MITTILATIFVLGALIFFHELGHFAVAKRVGIRVEKFSLGFGPKLLGWTRGDTEYLVSLFPLGGYVKMAGENPDEEVTGAHYEFSSKTVKERLAVVLAGPFMNFIVAFFLLYIVCFIGKPTPAYLLETPVIGWVKANSAAEKAGLEIGDQLIAIDGKEVKTWGDASLAIMSNPGLTVPVVLRRGGTKLNKMVTITSMPSNGVGSIGAMHAIPPAIGQLDPKFPAAKAGFKKGDLILAIEGKKISHWTELSNFIHHNAGNEIAITIERSGSPPQIIKVVPKNQEIADGKTIGLIGIAPMIKQVIKQYGAFASLYYAGQEFTKLFTLTYEFLGKLFRGRVSGKQLGGPLMIASAAGSAAEAGASSLFYFMSMLSMQLAIMNLLPIPVLDGGHVFFLAIEALLSKPVNEKMRELSQQAGMVALLLLMVYVFYNDIMRMVG